MRKRNSFMSATIMCGLLVIAFHFDKDSVHWFWTGNEMVPIILGISAIVFGIFWFFESRIKARKVDF